MGWPVPDAGARIEERLMASAPDAAVSLLESVMDLDNGGKVAGEE